MILAADAAPSGPWWATVLTITVPLLVAIVTARGPVWVEKAKTRWSKAPTPTAATPPPGPVPTPVALIESKQESGETILREWLAETKAKRDGLEQDNRSLQELVDKLEKELYRRDWDGRLP